MVNFPAYGMIFLTQNPSTGNGKLLGCSFILSVGTLVDSDLKLTIELCFVTRRVSGSPTTLTLEWEDVPPTVRPP